MIKELQYYSTTWKIVALQNGPWQAKKIHIQLAYYQALLNKEK